MRLEKSPAWGFFVAYMEVGKVRELWFIFFSTGITIVTPTTMPAN